VYGYLLRKLGYGTFVLAGVVVVVFFLFQGFGDPARLVLGQSGDSATINNIRRELYLDQPKWKQFLLYCRDISPISVHSKVEIEKKGTARRAKLNYLRGRKGKQATAVRE